MEHTDRLQLISHSFVQVHTHGRIELKVTQKNRENTDSAV